MELRELGHALSRSAEDGREPYGTEPQRLGAWPNSPAPVPQPLPPHRGQDDRPAVMRLSGSGRRRRDRLLPFGKKNRSRSELPGACHARSFTVSPEMGDPLEETKHDPPKAALATV